MVFGLIKSVDLATAALAEAFGRSKITCQSWEGSDWAVDFASSAAKATEEKDLLALCVSIHPAFVPLCVTIHPAFFPPLLLLNLAGSF